MSTKNRLVKAMVFPVVMYGCESWTIRKVKAKELMLLNWRRLLRILSTARKSNQSILKEINPEYSLEDLMLKAEAPSLVMQRPRSLKMTLIMGKIEGRRRRG